MSTSRALTWVDETYRCLSRGDIRAAAKAADRARDADRKDPRVRLVSGHLLIMCGAYAEGLAELGQAETGFARLRLRVPGQLYCSRAVAYMKQFQHAEADHWFDRAIAHDPHQPEPWIGRGTNAMDRGDNATAQYWFDEASRRFPASMAVRWGRSMFRLRMGQWPQAWQDYEARLVAPDWLARWHTTMDATLWAGRPIPGDALCVFHEQGMGDTIMLSRYLPWVREASQCAKLYLMVPVEMERLFRPLLLDGTVQWIGPTNAPAHQWAVSIYSLPFLHQTRLDTVPEPLRLAA